VTHGYVRVFQVKYGVLVVPIEELSRMVKKELIQRVTGGPLRIDPYIAYLRRKFGELYAL